MLGESEEELARPAHDGGSGREHVERSGYERDQPNKGAEPHETVEVPRRVVCERASVPLELMRPRAQFLALILVRRFRRDCGRAVSGREGKEGGLMRVWLTEEEEVVLSAVG